MKIFKHLRKEWFRYGFETLAAIVVILAAFAPDSWNEDRKLQKEELKLLTDIQADRETAIESLKQNEEFLNSLSLLLRQRKQGLIL